MFDLFDLTPYEVVHNGKNPTSRSEDEQEYTEIVLGDTSFKVTAAPERMIISDKKTGESCVLLGDFDKSTVKKDLTEAFKDWHGYWDITINDIDRYVLKQQEKGNNAYINIDIDALTDLELEKRFDAIFQILGKQKKDGLEDEINQNQEDVWIKTDDKYYETEPDEKLKHTFVNKTVEFGIRYPLNKENPVCILTVSDGKSNGENVKAYVKGNVETAENLVSNTIRHFDQKEIPSILNIGSYLQSQIMESSLEVKLSDSDPTTQLAKKTGYVQGVCECVVAIGDDYTLGKKLLSEMNVSKDMAKKFANPETYKNLEQGIFAPQQKLEQTHSIKR